MTTMYWLANMTATIEVIQATCNFMIYDLIKNSKETFLAAYAERRDIMACEIFKKITNKDGIFWRYYKTAWQEYILANKAVAFVVISLNCKAGLFDDA